MRLPVVGNISTKDGATNKNARLTNMLAEQKKNGTTLATVRPGVISRGNADGGGNGLVCFNGALISVYSANLGYWTRYFDINNKEIFDQYGSGSIGYDATNAGVVVGKIVSGATTYAFRFDPDDGIENLGTLGGTNSEAYGVSDDGLIVVGKAQNASGQYRPFKWTSEGGMVDLGTLGGTSGYANGISGDGVTIVGGAFTSGSVTRAFRWTSGGGMVDIGAGDGSYSEAISYDGSVIAGTYSPSGFEHAFKWTSGGGVVDLGTLGGTRSYGRGISGDGSTIVGAAQSGSNYRAFRWTSGGGMISLGVVSGTESAAYDVSSDGSIIVGVDYNFGGPYYNAFKYESSMTLIDLAYTSIAYGCSPNGQIIVGQFPVGGGHVYVEMNQSIETGISTVVNGIYDFALIP